MEWEKIVSNNVIYEGLISKYTNNLYISTAKNPVNQLKNDQKTWIDNSPKKMYRCPIGMWKILNIINY